MTSRQRIVLLALLMLAAAGGCGYQAAVIRRQGIRLAVLAGQAAARQQQIGQLNRDRIEAARQLAALQAENGQLKGGATSAAASESAGIVVRSWLSRVRQLRQRLEEHPDQKIPELRLASEQDWLEVARADLNSDDDYRQALARLRFSATDKFALIAHRALKKYADANNGAFPASLPQLQSYFDDPADAAIVQRYAIIPENQIPYLKIGDEQVITQSSQVDQKYDSYVVMAGGGSGASFSSEAPVNTYLNLLNAYRAANQGQPPTDPSQLQPYATTPEQQALVQKAMQHAIRPSMVIMR